jgi:RNA polymerase sigma factor (sigma-70 family)
VDLIERLNAIPRLPLDEELELAQRAKGGDLMARDRVLDANLRVACMIIVRYREQLLPRAGDAVALGTEGLIEALAHFDPSRRVRLSTYAYPYVLQSIMRTLYYKQHFVVRRAEGRLRAGDVGGAEVSLDLPIDKRGHAIVDQLASDAPTPEDVACCCEEQCARIRQLEAMGFQRLDDRARLVLTETVMAEEPKTIAEVAARLGVSRQRVGQIRARALRQLREGVASLPFGEKRRCRRCTRRGHDIRRCPLHAHPTCRTRRRGREA